MRRHLILLSLVATSALAAVDGGTEELFRDDGRWEALERLQKQPNLLGSQYKIQATIFGIGDPVHETITMLAVQDTIPELKTATRSNADMWSYIRSVSWNDDPCGQLYSSWDNASVGLIWGLDFTAAEKNSMRAAGDTSTPAKVNCRLLAESHFGELQFLHGMATRAGLAATETQGLMMAWAELCWKVQAGLAGSTKLTELDPRLKPLIEAAPAGSTVESLFLPSGDLPIPRRVALRRVAISSLLHMVQDSQARGHIERIESGPEKGRIKRFLTYVGQDHKAHSKLDGWNINFQADRQKVWALRGGKEALDQSTYLLGLSVNGKPWEDAKTYLEGTVFKLASNVTTSGPGL